VFIHTKTEFIWDAVLRQYVVLTEEGYEHDGSVALCKGASDNQEALAQSQKEFADTLQRDYGTTFANNQAILNSLNSSLKPIVSAGIGQYGYSNAEDAAMRTQASAGTAANYQNARRAVGQAQAAAGGGDTFLPTGAAAANNAALARAAAQQESGQQLDITKSGYEQGRQNFLNAVNAEQGVAAGYNPTGYAGLSTSANASAANQEEDIAKLNNSASPWSTIGGILGGVAGQVAAPGLNKIGTKLSGYVG
jgi:hypothetical protein